MQVRECEEDLLYRFYPGRQATDQAIEQHAQELSLELGGNAPFIVFDDADLVMAVACALIAKFKVTCQSCVCANRIFVHEKVYDKFSQRLIEEVKKFRVGNGADTSVTHGPLTNGVAKVEDHIKDAVSKRATVLLGGRRLLSQGKSFHELTLLGNVDDTMLVASEETFGPIVALLKFSSEDEVVARANKSDVGLASYIMTRDLGERIVSLRGSSLGWWLSTRASSQTPEHRKSIPVPELARRLTPCNTDLVASSTLVAVARAASTGLRTI